jgi:zinc D-Ala-D-Ala carboxypeptidase
MEHDPISAHFTFAELTRTDTGLANEPSEEQEAQLARLANIILEPMRTLVGPLHVDSGFRTLAVNTRIDGAHNSQHMLGQAADVVPLQMGLEVAFRAVKASATPFDQLILEPSWLHASVAAFGSQPRRQCLRAHREGERMLYEHA